MIKISSRQVGSVHVVVIAVLVLALVGALGFVFWQNFMQPAKDDKTVQTSQKDLSEKPAEICAGYGDAVEKDKVFCSKDIGIEFKIPDIFAGKFQKKENYEVFKGGMEDASGSPAGKSLYNYAADVVSGDETLTLSVAKEPLRSGYSSMGHALQRTYFNENNGDLSLVKGPEAHYDSTTNTRTITGGWGVGELVPYFNVGNAKVYHGKIGDAGVLEDGYLTVLRDGIVVIKIKHAVNPMETAALDADKIFVELDTYLKQLKFLD